MPEMVPCDSDSESESGDEVDSDDEYDTDNEDGMQELIPRGDDQDSDSDSDGEDDGDNECANNHEATVDNNPNVLPV